MLVSPDLCLQNASAAIWFLGLMREDVVLFVDELVHGDDLALKDFCLLRDFRICIFVVFFPIAVLKLVAVCKEIIFLEVPLCLIVCPPSSRVDHVAIK